MRLTDFDSFSALLVHRDIQAELCSRSIDQLEAMDTMAAIRELGDEILCLFHRGVLPDTVACSLITELLPYCERPLNSMPGVIAIQRKLRGYKV